MRKINLIVIHSSATPSDRDIGVDVIRKWHVDERGFADIGYHYVIRRDGRIEAGRPVGIAGAHVRGHNESSIGICMIGGVNDALNAEDNFNGVQMDTLEVLINFLTNIYGIEIGSVVGHRDLNDKTECPSFDVKKFTKNDWYRYMRGVHKSERLVKEKVSE